MALRMYLRHYRFIVLLLFLVTLATILALNAVQGQAASEWGGTFSYISPLPDAQMVSAGTTLAVRGGPLQGAALLEAISFDVNGTQSGYHAGQTLLAGDEQTVIFRPRMPFLGGENVQVTITLGQGSVYYAFQVADQASIPLSDEVLLALEGLDASDKNVPETTAADVAEIFRTAPSNLPRMEVTKGGGSVGEGYVFMSPFDFATFGSNVAYLLILDNDGEPVFYRDFEEAAVMDFKRQPNGQLTYYDRAQGKFLALNERYEIERSYTAGNGYPTNMHDLQLLDNGNVLLTVYDLQIMDMSTIVDGGQTNAQVLGCIAQELDSKGNVLFEWRSWDHIDLFDTTRDLTFKLIDYVHCNSIERDNDGNLLLSGRNTDEITKIDRQTGEIIWRMGGKQNEFTFINDSGFSRQHDARRLDNGNLTLFDNGVMHSPQRSRGLELAVDEQNKVVTVLREFHDTAGNYARYMGDVQRLPNGNSVIGWGSSSSPAFSEFDALGSEVLKFKIASGEVSYRSFRFPWQGKPSWAPVLIAYANGNVADLFFSWNGSTDSSGYMVFAAHESGGEWHVNNVAKDGFENSYQVYVPYGGRWKFWVVAIDENYRPTVSSNVVTLLIGGEPYYFPMVAAR